MSRVFNFSAGPAALPLDVLEIIRNDIPATVGRRKTPHVLKVTIPHLPAVVSIDGEYVVLALDVKDTVGKDGHRCAPVPRHDSSRPRTTPPQHPQRKAGQRVFG